MRTSGMFLIVFLLTLLLPRRHTVLAQGIDCDNCVVCPNPFERDTHDTYPGQPVLAVNMVCEELVCNDFISCPEEENEEEELLAALSDGNPLALMAFVSGHKESVVVIPERKILVILGGCRDSRVLVLPLRASQLKALTE